MALAEPTHQHLWFERDAKTRGGITMGGLLRCDRMLRPQLAYLTLARMSVCALVAGSGHAY
jgi:hypothetical protein